MKRGRGGQESRQPTAGAMAESRAKALFRATADWRF
jgi:hypothetical protein